MITIMATLPTDLGVSDASPVTAPDATAVSSEEPVAGAEDAGGSSAEELVAGAEDTGGSSTEELLSDSSSSVSFPLVVYIFVVNCCVYNSRVKIARIVGD